MAIMDTGGGNSNPNLSMAGAIKLGMNAWAVILLVVILILLAQYGSKKIALSIAALIFLSTLIFNIEKLKEVFKNDA